MVGYLFRPVGVIKRILFLLAAVGLLIPDRSQRQVCSPNLGQQQYRARAGDLTCIGGVAGALVSRPRADGRRRR